MKQKPKDYSSVQKAIKIVEAFASDNREMGTVELSENLGIHMSTVSRLLNVMTYYRLVQQNPGTKKYSLGKLAADMGRAVNESLSISLVDIARPFLEGLRNRVGESVALEVLSGDSVILASELKGPPPVSVSFNIGDRVPFHVAAGAKAILAFCPTEMVDRLINGKLARFTPNTITKPTVLKKQLEEIRQKGVAFDKGERNVDVYSIGAPIFNFENKPVAAIAVAILSHKIESILEAGVVSMLKDTSSKISSQLFYD
ncbi:MAG: IclR family transcriptional regulator [Deltaproteobacteria bacterium]|nr:IclR family transcriptional regulator [Deltaproteobacteria bacterium]MBW1863334.1 IclR family transcriptional regulator [Deltaproteobacteria bacterium]